MFFNHSLKSNPKSDKVFYINKYFSNQDENELRKNLFVDVGYIEIKFEFNENKIFGNIIAHFAGDFNLPQSSLKMNIIFPKISIENISLNKTSFKIDKNFPYGFENSYIYFGKFELDTNENQNIWSNDSIDINGKINFDIDIKQLDGLKFDENNNINQFINELRSIEKKIKINFNEDFIIKNNENNNKITYLTTELTIFSNLRNKNNQYIEPNQKTKNQKIIFEFDDYSNINYEINKFFSINIQDASDAKINIESIQFKYLLNDIYMTTNKLNINKTYELKNKKFDFILNNYTLSYDQNKKNYEIVNSENNFFVQDNFKGEYLININVYINGRLKKYLLNNSFSFIKKDIKFAYFDNEDKKINEKDLIIKNDDIHYEIKQ